MAPTRFEGEKVDPAPLGQPLSFEFSGKTAKNRFLKAAMSEKLSSWDTDDLTKRGVPSKEIINMYRRWGQGGSGAILTGNIMIEYDQLEAPGNLIIPAGAPFSGERFEAFKQLATGAKEHGSLLYAQISHPGRQVTADIQPNPISASDVAVQKGTFGMEFGKPKPMDKGDFDRVISEFAHAAEYCHKAGFDGVQLHGAHGYLLAQFLAPQTNLRTDKYGGSLLNRARIILEIADAIKARVADKSFSISIKLNSVEFQEGGFSSEDCRDLCVKLEEHGFDWVELSGGTYEEVGFSHRKESTSLREAFFLEFAEMIIPELKKTKLYITGGLRTAWGMVKALETVDGIGLGRPVANQFDLPQKILDGKVNGAIKSLFGEDDFGMGITSSQLQMRLVGHDQEPLDLSSEAHNTVMMQAISKWAERREQDKNYVEPPSIEDFKLEPYGTAYVVA